MAMKQTELAYAAGLMDGRGNFGFYASNGRWQVLVRLNSSNPDIIDWFQTRWPAPTYEWLRETEGNRLPKFRWQLAQRDDVAAFVREIRPYLVFKAAEAQILEEALAALRDGATEAQMRRLQAEFKQAAR